MFNFILAIQIIVAIAMVGLILLQHGKGADAGASFGSGASGTVFGAAGSANFLTRATAVLTAIFFATSLLLAIQARKIETDQRRLDVTEIKTETATPAIEPVATETAENTPQEVDNKAETVDNKAEETNSKTETVDTNTKAVEANLKTETVDTKTEKANVKAEQANAKTEKATTEKAETEMTEEQIEKQLAIIRAETEELTEQLDKSE